MKALVFHKPKDVRYEDWPDPRIEHVKDVIVKITTSTICGSDLHIYNGYLAQPRKLVLGHECVGVVQDIGPRVTNFKKGDRVVVPFPIGCGECWFCRNQQVVHCEKTNPYNYGPDGTLTEKGAGLYGYTDLYGGYPGCQAEMVRVPYGDFNLRKLPDEITDEQAIMLADICPTGWCGALWADVKEGDTVAVWGCGPVGIMAMKAAKLKGAKRVIGVDILEYRLELARRLAQADTLNAELGDPVEILRSLTDGRGPDGVIDCIGMEADHTWLESAGNLLKMQVGTTKALRACMRAVRRGGSVSVIGVYGLDYQFPLGQFFDKGLQMRAGQAIVHNVIDELMGYIKDKRLVVDDVITHRVALEDGPIAYDVFNDKKEDSLKFILRP